MTSRALQRGFSLVEMMVALIIGLFVLAGVGSVYITGKRSYNARDGLSLLQENGRIAIRMIEQTVQRAGYPKRESLEPVVHVAGQVIFDNPTPKKLPKVLVSADSGNCAISSKNGRLECKCDSPIPVSGNVNACGDLLSTVYQPVEDWTWEEGTDCLGNESDRNKDGEIIEFNPVVSSLYALAGREDETKLMCLGSHNASPGPLADNVLMLQAEYGEDRDGDGFPDQYVQFDKIGDWERMVAIRVALLVSSGEDVLDEGVTDKKTYTLGGDSVELDLKGDRKLYRVFTTTIPLRNRMSIF